MCEMRPVIYLFILKLILIILQAIDHFLAQPINKYLTKHTLSNTKWKVLQDFELILMVHCHMQMCFALRVLWSKQVSMR